MAQNRNDPVAEGDDDDRARRLGSIASRKLAEDTDDLLDEIDDVLEENAEDSCAHTCRRAPVNRRRYLLVHRVPGPARPDLATRPPRLGRCRSPALLIWFPTARRSSRALPGRGGAGW